MTIKRINKTFPNSKFINLKSRVGFTLIELILYMALMSIFLIVLSELFISTLEVRKESEATSSVEADGRYILSRLSYDINRAQSVSVPQVPVNSDSTLTLVISGGPSTYAQVSGNLTLTNSLGTNNLNGSGSTVSSLNFQRIGTGTAPTIKIDFTLTSATERIGGSEIRNFTTTIGLR